MVLGKMTHQMREVQFEFDVKSYQFTKAILDIDDKQKRKALQRFSSQVNCKYHQHIFEASLEGKNWYA